MAVAGIVAACRASARPRHFRRTVLMPLVRIDLRMGKSAAYRQEIGPVVYEALLSAGVQNDRVQVIGEHEAGDFDFDPDYRDPGSGGP